MLENKQTFPINRSTFIKGLAGIPALIEEFKKEASAGSIDEREGGLIENETDHTIEFFKVGRTLAVTIDGNFVYNVNKRRFVMVYRGQTATFKYREGTLFMTKKLRRSVFNYRLDLVQRGSVFVYAASRISSYD